MSRRFPPRSADDGWNTLPKACRAADDYPIAVPALWTSLAMTASASVVPLMARAQPSGKSIQPSLKPSSMRMRGMGFCAPCARNSASQLSRATASARTGCPINLAKAAARLFGDRRWGPSSSTTTFLSLPNHARPVRNSLSTHPPSMFEDWLGDMLPRGMLELVRSSRRGRCKLCSRPRIRPPTYACFSRQLFQKLPVRKPARTSRSHTDPMSGVQGRSSFPKKQPLRATTTLRP